MATTQLTAACFSYSNPDSVNGPFGDIKLWLDGSSVHGSMTVQLLFGLPSTSHLILEGTDSGSNPIICTMRGTGVSVSVDKTVRPVAVQVVVSFAAGEASGQVTITSDLVSAQNLPLQTVDCAAA